MYTKLIFIILLATISAHAESRKLEIEGFQKEIINENHYRFSRGSINIHYQTEGNESNWSKKTFQEDSKKMLSIRTKMYEILGFKEVKFLEVNLEETPNIEMSIRGTYLRPDKKRIFFIEKNYYHGPDLIQLKVMSENQDISEQDLKNIISHLAPTVI